MQTTRLFVAQLMGEFLGGQNARLTQELTAAEFSQELQAQHSNHFGMDPTMLSMGSSTRKGEDGPDQIPETQNFLLPALACTPMTQPARRALPVSAESRPALNHTQAEDALRPLQVGSRQKLAKAGERIVFTDGLLVEKIATQLRLPAEKKAACLAAADNAGRIPLTSLLEILNIPGRGPGNLVHKPEAAAEDVRLLFRSVELTKAGVLPQKTMDLTLKAKGSYDLDEIKKLLSDVVSHVDEMQKKVAPGGSAHPTSTQVNERNSDLFGAPKNSVSLLHPTKELVAPFSVSPEVDTGNGMAETLSRPDSPGKQSSSGEKLETRPAKFLGDPQPNPARAVAASFLEMDVEIDQRSFGPPADGQAANLTLDDTLESRFVDAESLERFENITRARLMGGGLAKNFPGGGRHNVTNLSTAEGETVLVGNMEQGTIATKPDARDDRLLTARENRAEPFGMTRGEIKTGLESGGEKHFFQGHGQEHKSTAWSLSGAAPPGGEEKFAALFPNDSQVLNPGQAASGDEKLPQGYVSSTEFIWAEKIAQYAQRLRAKNRNQLTLQLQSGRLGALAVRIETRRDQVAAFIVAQNEYARSSLVQNASLLHESLQQQGLHLSEMVVDVRQEPSEGLLQGSAKEARAATGKPAKRPGLPAPSVSANDGGISAINLFA
ncbi:flagellar hook-length control protein FliK [Desulfoferrobacter suflitae]|uniref:flagellar hook-length control protein FliK n=1 Tax=Desulfoferrobacter suflitae TaxID=2865782 RepID=UPI00216497CE|nr:flagellar hook-length control protein FliK [Desulfoferrobacter suflitae]MCK8602436.1 flagellar hook-length control protein FliK [Desulfoferrobacter suflitae]